MKEIKKITMKDELEIKECLQRIKLLQVDGDTGNRYYGSGYEIIVKAPLKGFS